MSLKVRVFVVFFILWAFVSLSTAHPKTKSKAISTHSKAAHIKDGWIRDPYIVLGPDNYYYLTGTTPLPGDPREQSDYYNTGLKKTSIVGYKLQVWKSLDLVNWEYVGTPYSVKNIPKYRSTKEDIDWSQQRLWAPELHWVKDKWALVTARVELVVWL